MSSLPLARFALLRTTDAAEAQEKVGQILARHRLEVADDGVHRLDVRLNSYRGQDISVNALSYGTDVRVSLEAPRRHFLVSVPLAGKAEVRDGHRRVLSRPGIGLVASPRNFLTVRWPADCRHLIVRIEQTALEARLSRIIGTPLACPLHFAPRMDLTKGHGLSWCRILNLMVDELDHPGALLAVPARSEKLERALLTTLLEAQPHNHSDALRHPGIGDRARTFPQHVREAKQVIDDHPEWQHSISSLAQHVSYTARGLQKGFSRHVGISPTMYLRQVRLRRVRDALLAASPDSTTADAVAQRWGFRHYGHFAALYRKEFDESPKDTLHR